MSAGAGAGTDPEARAGDGDSGGAPRSPAVPEAVPIPDVTAADGTRLAAWTLGHGPGRPLLLVPGQAVDHRSWRLAAPVLGQGRPLVLVDHRGTGASGRSASGVFSTRDLAADLVRVIDAAGLESVDLLGHSMGGRVAQWFAVDHPSRLGRLVLAATNAGDRHTVTRDPEAGAALRSGEIARIRPFFFDDDVPVDVARSLLVVTTDARMRQAHYLASRRHDALAELSRITAPTLVLHGSADRLTPPDSARLVAHTIPRARLAILRGAAHGVVLDGGLGATLAARFLSRPV
ncbi:alpha/beta hydrolase fold protein [Cnuibacter physcomitrellae]|uniref:Serine aminopeptidase S33 domain-containing protein n=1 Tax=Cnuibacter physcomitrellae TaxID=1619308 RepID=A0A1X9LRW8_9MICO|nr:alpha/beta fold hydrolase [Cnuibacter physcomitrellae]ARJ06691.1 hypothetical protein B5808_16775 [Cnuibacter physcomitrellae]GGI38610.1 alpha/beta hydrolase fold protein [Cnuibacter physcomitrellae]